MSGVAATARRVEWWRPMMGEREKELIGHVIDSGFVNDGPKTAELERQIAALCQVPYAVATTSGTAAIFLALAACGVGPGDEVLVPDITFIATANAVSLTGATPVLVDVDERTLCIDPAAAQAAITPCTKAIVPVHVSGRAAAMEPLLDLARRHGLRVVEDSAEALGSLHKGTPLGGLGDAGCFSFTANKTITSGQGGVVVTRDAGVHRRLRELKDQGRPERGTGGADTHVALGYNFKYTDLQAAMALAQLETFDERRDHLRHVYALYAEYLPDHPAVRLPGFDLDGGECPQWVDAVAESPAARDSLLAFLDEARIETRKFWYPVHTQTPYRRADTAYPVSARVGQSAFWLPTAYGITDDDVRYVCRRIADWIGAR